jgi:hypothetical protein
MSLWACSFAAVVVRTECAVNVAVQLHAESGIDGVAYMPGVGTRRKDWLVGFFRV